MKKQLQNILLLALITSILFSCDAVKRVAEDEYLLTKNVVTINDKKDKTETINRLIIQEPNRKIIGTPLRLHLYNTARPNRDSIFEAWVDKKANRRERLNSIYSQKQVDRLKKSVVGFNSWLKKTGEAPVIINEKKTKKSVNLLKAYHINNGWFDVEADYNIIKGENKRAEINYTVETGPAFILDSITTTIKSPIIENLYEDIKKEAILKPNEQYKTSNFENERERISNSLRNSGIYHFKQDYVTFQIDTIGTNKKVNVNLTIQDRAIRTSDSIKREPFEVYKISDVNIITDYTFENRNKPFQDSVTFNGYNLYSYGKMKYKPRTLTDAVFITPGDIYKDKDLIRTYRHLKELRTFRYPNIEISERLDKTLSDTILLTPLKKFSLGFGTDVSQSNIQTIGLSLNPSLLMRNIFRGAETLEISGKGSIGASKERSPNANDAFFDIIEYGIDLRLTIPRFFSPFYTKHLIPKYMSPTTNITLSTTSQTNIGLDKQTFSGIFNYNWHPNEKVSNRLDVFNVQYVRNLNVDRYFYVYNNSFNTLNQIAKDVDYIDPDTDLTRPEGAEEFINYALGPPPADELTEDQLLTVNSINERKTRLTENNLILSTSFNLTIDERTNLFDKDFSIFRVRIEPAGNLLSLTSKLLNLKKDASNRYNLFNVAYSQFIKTELDYIKHWDLGKKNVLAIRSFFGIAIPYGNSNSIPFSKSFFAGGPNDNRAWSAYNLGPGSSRTTNEFNEANMKLAFSAEHRFNLFDKLNGALFIDAGNIWNVLDSETDERAIFSGLKSLNNIAVGSGIGLRYDFRFFVFRLDIGLKTYNPALPEGKRWFKEYNFRNAVYNIGINYPF
ncbi:BamA/TamA family outer membrane protein [Tamlana sp. 2201CG12-4]|uniref:translocation and assembly module lipoprotein TamL n=1 Tax=Tamlana sp. 2201CG12-4 TaxID=3112582 RepID=UPI002DBB7B94|nr:BamA/TamA family outer membrane protein [Tamlana sp. 2201CG12-4]MEC3907118.1 BamA/TamA family outer membrane protein [Tamlana sp. 2201CG12-4]